jgi:hypothetical protein
VRSVRRYCLNGVVSWFVFDSGEDKDTSIHTLLGFLQVVGGSDRGI